tara:strand:+ start:169 stop:867 length:699 start_codon:yes stop_codon:yes gene_type:complete
VFLFQGKDLVSNISLLDNIKSREIIEIACDHCGTIKQTTKHKIQNKFRKKPNRKGIYCSSQCSGLDNRTVPVIPCSECNKPVRRYRDARSKSDRRFCNRSCAASYNNKNKTYGTRRSKLEIYLEEQIRLEYPNLEMICNEKSAIGSELDFYFPQLKLAIELNGIFHYEPIYGQDKLEKIQNNDKQKMRRCLEEGIEFCTVDSSSCSYLSKHNKTKYLNIFKQIIEPLLGRAV